MKASRPALAALILVLLSGSAKAEETDNVSDFVGYEWMDITAGSGIFIAIETLGNFTYVVPSTATVILGSAASGLLAGDGIADLTMGDDLLEHDQDSGIVLMERSFQGGTYEYAVTDYDSYKGYVRNDTLLGAAIAALSDEEAKTGAVRYFDSEYEARGYYFSQVAKARGVAAE